MLNIELSGHDYEYGVNDIINLFIEDKEKCNYLIRSSLIVNNFINVSSKIIRKGKVLSDIKIKKQYNKELSQKDIRKLSKRLIKLSLFRALKKVTNEDIPWGILTGIRPTKVVQKMFDTGLKDKEINDILTNDYEICDNRAKLLIQVYQKERKVIEKENDKNISLYVGIPFCPTRCLYCSFPSCDIEHYGFLVEDYLDALTKEIYSAKDIISNNLWKVKTIYVGGGTPTSLNEKQLDKLLKELNKNFSFNEINEITIEAGRPDTITKAKLKLLYDYGIRRISINPQTMNDDTLIKIGRNHTAKDIINSYNLAREIGFENINMDIIVGLPDENENYIIKTLEEIKDLNPSNLTVHTLSIKRTSMLNQNIQRISLTHPKVISNMIELTKKFTEQMNLSPYYLYRQKNILGNFENVGYCKENFECIYNILIIEEIQSILALGAGGVSKIINCDKKIESIFNVKDVKSYIDRIDEMIDRKRILYK